MSRTSGCSSMRDPGDHVVLAARDPLLVVDREGGDGRPAAHNFRRKISAQAVGADRGRRMHEPVAIVAAEQAQLSVCAARPEEAVLLVEAWHQPERRSVRGHGQDASHSDAKGTLRQLWRT